MYTDVATLRMLIAASVHFSDYESLKFFDHRTALIGFLLLY